MNGNGKINAIYMFSTKRLFLIISLFIQILLLSGCSPKTPVEEYVLFSSIPEKITICAKQYGDEELIITNSLAIKELLGIAQDSFMVLSEGGFEDDLNEKSLEIFYSDSQGESHLILSFSAESYLLRKNGEEEQAYLIKNSQLLCEYAMGEFRNFIDNQEEAFKREDDISKGKFYVLADYPVNEALQLVKDAPTKEDLIEILLQAHSLGLISNCKFVPFDLNIDVWDTPTGKENHSYYTFSDYPDIPYLKVHYGGFHSISDIKVLLSTVFCDEYITNLLSCYNDTGYLIEKDGNLYHPDYLAAGGDCYGLAWLDSFKYIDENEIDIMVKYEYCESCFLSEKESKGMEIHTIIYHLKRYHTQWKFTEDFTSLCLN